MAARCRCGADNYICVEWHLYLTSQTPDPSRFSWLGCARSRRPCEQKWRFCYCHGGCEQRVAGVVLPVGRQGLQGANSLLLGLCNQDHCFTVVLYYSQLRARQRRRNVCQFEIHKDVPPSLSQGYLILAAWAVQAGNVATRIASLFVNYLSLLLQINRFLDNLEIKIRNC